MKNFLKMALVSVLCLAIQGVMAVAAPNKSERPPMVQKEKKTEGNIPDNGTTGNDEIIWATDFNDLNGWYDIKTDVSFNASIELLAGGRARVLESGNKTWGRVCYVLEKIDFDRHPVLSIKIDSVDKDAAFKVGVDKLNWKELKDLTGSKNEPGKYDIDLTKTGWSGVITINLCLFIEGDNKGFVIDKMQLKYIGGEKKNKDNEIKKSGINPGSIVWSTEFDNLEGWYDIKTDKSLNAGIELIEKGKARVGQAGDNNWGKVIFVLSDIEFDRKPVLIINVDSVEPESAFKIGVDNLKWNDFKVLKESTNNPGEYEIDMTTTGWTGRKTFNLILIVEGKNKGFVVDKIILRDTP